MEKSYKEQLREATDGRCPNCTFNEATREYHICHVHGLFFMQRQIDDLADRLESLERQLKP